MVAYNRWKNSGGHNTPEIHRYSLRAGASHNYSIQEAKEERMYQMSVPLQDNCCYGGSIITNQLFTFMYSLRCNITIVISMVTTKVYGAPKCHQEPYQWSPMATTIVLASSLTSFLIIPIIFHPHTWDCAVQPPGMPRLTSLCNFLGDNIKTDRLYIAYSQYHNIGNLLSYWIYIQPPGAKGVIISLI